MVEPEVSWIEQALALGDDEDDEPAAVAALLDPEQPGDGVAEL